MELYQTLQELLNSINQSAVEARYAEKEREVLNIILENQGRLGEAMLIVGGLLKAILAHDVEVEIIPPQKEAQH